MSGYQQMIRNRKVLVKMQRKGKPVHLQETAKCCSHCEKVVEIRQKGMNDPSLAPNFGCIQKNQTRSLQRLTWEEGTANSSWSGNKPKCPSTDKWRNKTAAMLILFSLEKEGTCHMPPHGCTYTYWWKVSTAERTNVVWFHFYEVLEEVWSDMQRTWLPGLGDRGWAGFL